MARARSTEEEFAGQDSFLDVIANIVGILILLVMVVGVRASHHAASDGPAPAVAAGPTEAEIEAAFERARATLRENAQLAQKGAASQADVAFREAERDETVKFIAELEQAIAAEREQLGENQRRNFDQRRQLGDAQLELDRLARKQVAVASLATEVTTMESLPTPLAETVSGDEVHLRLAGGRVSIVPIEALLATAKRDMQDNLWRLQDRDEVEGWVGPIDGYRMVYGLQKGTVSIPGRGTGTMVRSVGFELQPQTEAMGVPVEDAIRRDSLLAAMLARRRPESTTVTVWTYSDSFDEFRTLKKQLFEWGYATAARPLPDGVLIGGSPSGSKSSAQ
ncbi:hypothetical protein Pla175_11330 [Pirellulimonas nuda]|uniref:Uncharacterized protein n=1 Tax=Pirellulimonas nuda TaxID=2528009 RepID=A0A518D8G4_9BACT|nr:hypothetical protein [Pirellulimonas nuda]QDU87767.1 hypothetical protein Pla175_11330 [Pirellulimonas nuda]